MRPNLQCDDGRKMLGGRAEEDRVREEVGQKDPRHVKKLHVACSGITVLNQSRQILTSKKRTHFSHQI